MIATTILHVTLARWERQLVHLLQTTHYDDTTKRTLEGLVQEINEQLAPYTHRLTPPDTKAE